MLNDEKRTVEEAYCSAAHSLVEKDAMNIPKPHLSKFTSGRWMCRSEGTHEFGVTQGFGSTPEIAYEDWHFKAETAHRAFWQGQIRPPYADTRPLHEVRVLRWWVWLCRKFRP